MPLIFKMISLFDNSKTVSRTFQTSKVVSLISNMIPTYFSTHMKQKSHCLCSQPAGNSWHLGSISQIGTSIMFCPYATQSLRITWVKYILLNLRPKTRQKATLLDNFCRSGGTVIFILPFMTNFTFSISISQIFRSWVAIYQFRPPRASLSHSLYAMSGLAPRMKAT